MSAELAELGLLSDLCGHRRIIFVNGVGQFVALFPFGGGDGGLDVAYQGIDVARSGGTGEGRRYRAAALMAEDNDEPDAQMFDRVLDTPKRIVIYQISGSPNDEEVPDSLVEDNFGGRP